MNSKIRLELTAKEAEILLKSLSYADANLSDLEEVLDEEISEQELLSLKAKLESKTLATEESPLEQQNRELVEALKFYADIDSWKLSDSQACQWNLIEKSDLGVGDFEKSTTGHHWQESVDDTDVGGKKAREVLAKIGVKLEPSKNGRSEIDPANEMEKLRKENDLLKMLSISLAKAYQQNFDRFAYCLNYSYEVKQALGEKVHKRITKVFMNFCTVQGSSYRDLVEDLSYQELKRTTVNIDELGAIFGYDKEAAHEKRKEKFTDTAKTERLSFLKEVFSEDDGEKT